MKKKIHRYFHPKIFAAWCLHSPKPSRTRPVDNSIVRRPCSFGVGIGVENDVVTDLVTLFGGISITAGLGVATGFASWIVV